MNERMLLESGKMFGGSRISSIGADVVDDSQTLAIPVLIPEGKADIISVTAPETFTPGVAFPIGVVIKNIGTYADMLFVRLTNVDTGDDLGRQQIYLNAGQTGTALSFILNLVQGTDFNCRIDAGHDENGVDVVDDTRTITILVFIPEGKAAIVSVSAPDTFTPGVSFTIGVMIKNVGTYVDRLFVRITNIDTGEVLGAKSLDVNAGETTMPILFPITLVQETDFNGLIEAGHLED